MNSKVFLKYNARLGEGIHWDDTNKLIWFVDIHSKRLLSLSLKKEIKTYQLSQKIGWVLTINNEKNLLLGLEQGVALFDPSKNGKILGWVKKFNKNPKLRLNDAKADRFGNIWGGTLNDKNENSDDGFFYILKNNGDFKILEKNYNVPNGPVILHESNSILHTDSLKRVIYEYKVDFKNFVILEKNTFKQFIDQDGYPDGMTKDRNGNIFVAMWGNGIIKKLDPLGNEISSIQLPVDNVTNLCFCGRKLDRLFATSAKSKNNNELDGSIFEIINHETVGLNSYRAAPFKFS